MRGRRSCGVADRRQGWLCHVTECHVWLWGHCWWLSSFVNDTKEAAALGRLHVVWRVVSQVHAGVHCTNIIQDAV
jgi:hypothetical protein